MNTQTGELFTPDELNAKFDSMTDEQKAEFKKVLKRLDKPAYDKYAALPEGERPIALAFDQYLAGKRRYHETRTQRQAFYAGYHSALANQPKSDLEVKLEALKEKAEEMEKIATDGLAKK